MKVAINGIKYWRGSGDDRGGGSGESGDQRAAVAVSIELPRLGIKY